MTRGVGDGVWERAAVGRKATRIARRTKKGVNKGVIGVVWGGGDLLQVF